MTEEVTEVAEQVAPAVAPTAEIPAAESVNNELPAPPEEIKIESEAAAEPPSTVEIKKAAQPSPKTPNHAKGKRDRVKPVSTSERRDMWKKTMLERGEFKQEFFIDALTDYASKNRGYDAAHWWGGTLITMMSRLSEKVRTKLRTFSPSDVEYMTTKLMRFMVEKPLGQTVAEWNGNYHSNGEQRKAVDAFFSVDKPLFKIAERDLVFIQVRNAAWPSKKEEAKNIGGTFAERFHYLVSAVLKFLTTDQSYIDALFETAYHDKPVDEYIEFANKTRKENPATSWIGDDGKCSDCGSDITTDANGNQICSNPICVHNVAVGTNNIPKGFGERRNGPFRPRGGSGFVPQPSAEPRPSKGPGRDWKKKDRRFDGGDADGDMPRQHHHHKKGPRFHQNDDEFAGDQPASPAEGATWSSTPGSENLGSIAGLFDNLGQK